MFAKISFGLLSLMAASLAAISVWGDMSLYTSPVMVAMWTLTVLTAVIVCVRRRLWRRPVVCSLHLAFLLILAGALLTSLTGKSDNLNLRVGETRDGLTLTDFSVVTYEATQTPRDFVASVSDDRGGAVSVSMNHPGHLGGRTLILGSYDSDFGGASFTISSDPWGLEVTWAGYALLALSLISYFFVPGTDWRRALRALSVIVLFVTVAPGVSAAALSREFVSELGGVAVFHNGRVAPFESMARDFATTIGCRRDPMTVTSGLLFDFGRWADEKIVKVKDRSLREILAIDGSLASFNDFLNAIGSGRLNVDDPATARRFGPDISRFQAVSMLVRGSMLRLFPVRSDGGSVTWYSPADKIAGETDDDQWIFIRKFLGLLNERVVAGDMAGQLELLDALGRYQQRETSGKMPTRSRLAFEQLYSRVASQWWPGVAVAVAGLLLFIAGASGVTFGRGLLLTVSGLLWLWITALIVMRWIVCGHVPLSNGYETMMFLAWCLATASFAGRLVGPMAVLGSGLALCVASMSGAGASVSGLMPVLDSPLLSMHVVVVMASYALFFMMAMTGLLGLLRRSREARMAALGRVMLYPALALLTAGIFIGAVWAYLSWGRYWGWDPKETWALITMLVYAFAVHPRLLPSLGRDRVFNIFVLAAFVTVLITYFGVNFLMGGLHSYA